MLHHHVKAIAKLSSHASLKNEVRRYFGLPLDRALISSMLERGLGQADLVLALLRIRHPEARHYVELLIGHPITVAPPVHPQWRVNGRPTSTRRRVSNMERRIKSVVPVNPRQPGTAAYARWRDIRVGRSFQELLTRGHKKRDLRRALKMGWIS